MERRDLTQLEKNLISFLRLFQNRPYHLSKYLLDNNCLKEDFVFSIEESKKLNELTKKYEDSDIPTVYFLNFKEMMKFFENISNEYNLSDFETNKVAEELNTKLNSLIKSEKYEEAIKIRDFMIQNNIPRLS